MYTLRIFNRLKRVNGNNASEGRMSNLVGLLHVSFEYIDRFYFKGCKSTNLNRYFIISQRVILFYKNIVKEFLYRPKFPSLSSQKFNFIHNLTGFHGTSVNRVEGGTVSFLMVDLFSWFDRFCLGSEAWTSG